MREIKVDLGQRVLDFIDGMRGVTHHDTICRRIAQEMDMFGFQFVTVWDMPKPGTSIKNGFLYNSRPAEYVELYDTNNYVVIDPIVSAVRARQAPVVWSDIPREGLRKAQARIFNEAGEFGVANGIVIPIISAEGMVSVFSASGRDPDVTQSARCAIEIIGMHSHQLLHRALKAEDRPASLKSLSPREREIMTWIAAGKTDEDIAGILHIRRETVITHVNNAKVKLNATRRTHAVVLAMRSGQIEV